MRSAALVVMRRWKSHVMYRNATVKSVSVRCRIYQVLDIIRNKWLPAPSVTQRSKSTSTTWTKATSSAVPSAARTSKSQAFRPSSLTSPDDDDDDDDDEDEEEKDGEEDELDIEEDEDTEEEEDWDE